MHWQNEKSEWVEGMKDVKERKKEVKGEHTKEMIPIEFQQAFPLV